MTKRNKPIFHQSNVSILRLALLSFVAAAPTLVAADNAMNNEQAHASHAAAAPAKLVEIVRTATRHFIDVNAATATNYIPLFGCVSGPDHGAMGVHYINLSLVGDGEIDSSRPEALIYEPSKDGLRLVGVEFIVDAATWLAHHSSPPMLEGQAFQFVGSPNRYGLAAPLWTGTIR